MDVSRVNNPRGGIFSFGAENNEFDVPQDYKEGRPKESPKFSSDKREETKEIVTSWAKKADPNDLQRTNSPRRNFKSERTPSESRSESRLERRGAFTQEAPLLSDREKKDFLSKQQQREGSQNPPVNQQPQESNNQQSRRQQQGGTRGIERRSSLSSACGCQII